MVKCSAPMCTNSTYKKSPNITFHRFPKDDQSKTAWVANMNRKCWQPTRSSVLCSAHFEPHLVDHGGFRSVLTAAAVPTIFNLQQENKFTSKAKGQAQLNGSRNQDALQIKQNLQLVSAVLPSDSHSKIVRSGSLPGLVNKHSSGLQVRKDMHNVQPRTSAATYHNGNMETVRRLTKTNILKSKKIKSLHQQIRRLKNKVAKFANIISSLNEKLKDKYN